MARVLGLDIGANSVGWALVDDDGERIVDTGVRIFQEGVDKIDQREEMSRNAQRRAARMLRRQLDRRRRRKKRLRTILQNAGLLPADGPALAAVMRGLANPYALRRRALDHPLELHELGRVFYHLNQRRGFKSNRKAESQEETDGVIMQGTADGSKPGILVLREALDSGSYRTIGEYFASLDPHQTRIRERFTERSMYKQEFDAMWEAQRVFHPDVLTDALYDAIATRTIFFQRPLKSQKHRLGKCALEPGKFKAPKSSPLAQRVRMLQAVNNLRIKGERRITDEEQQLTADERAALLRYLDEHPQVDFTKPTQLRKALGLRKSDAFTVNVETIKGLTTEQGLRKALGDDVFVTLSPERIDAMWHALYIAEDKVWLEHHARTKWGMTQEQAEVLLKVKLEEGYARLSSKAMRKLLPFLEDGMMYTEAVMAAGYALNAHVGDGTHDRMPGVDTSVIRNPIVAVAMSQVRKVVNAIIAEYGKPDRIVVELTRSLKKPLKERLSIEKQNKETHARHTAIVQELQADGILERVTRDDIIRYKLWDDAGRRCVYSGRQIGLRELFHGAVDVDHIIPYSRSLDDSQANKVVCLREFNAEKGNRTPYETWGHDAEWWHAFKQRLGDLPHGKVKRLLADDEALTRLVGDDFISRQLNDTSYASLEARKYLQQVCADVQVSKGAVTADLRRYWGLNRVLDAATPEGQVAMKNREDHRHHAIDALVLACTSRSALQRLSAFNARDMRDAGKKPRLDPPWEDLLGQAIVATQRILVSHASSQRVRGAMHEQTVYGRARERFTGRARMEGKSELFVTRKRLADCKDTNPIYRIADDAVRKIVLDRLVECGVSRADLDAKRGVPIPKQAFANGLRMRRKDGTEGPLIKRVRLTKAANGMFNLKGDDDALNGTFVEPGSNDHLAVYRMDDSGKRVGIVTKLYQSYLRRRHGLPIVDTAAVPNATFLFSLRKNEMYLDATPEEYASMAGNPEALSQRLYRVQTLSEGDYRFRLHTVAVTKVTGVDGKAHEPGLKRISSVTGLKVRVCALGRIHRTDD